MSETHATNRDEAVQTARKAARKNMIVGAIWCIGGALVTVWTYQAARDGGTYVLAWGAVAFGAIQFIGGLLQRLRT